MPYAPNLATATMYAQPWYRENKRIVPTICPGSKTPVSALQRPYQQCQFCYTWLPIIFDLDTIMRPHELVLHIGETVLYGDLEAEIRSVKDDKAIVILLDSNTLQTVPVAELIPNPHRRHTFTTPDPAIIEPCVHL